MSSISIGTVASRPRALARLVSVKPDEVPGADHVDARVRHLDLGAGHVGFRLGADVEEAAGAPEVELRPGHRGVRHPDEPPGPEEVEVRLAHVLDDQVAHPLELARRDPASRLRLVHERGRLPEVVDQLAPRDGGEGALAALPVVGRGAPELAALHPGLEVEAGEIERPRLGHAGLRRRERSLGGPDGGLLAKREGGRLREGEPERPAPTPRGAASPGEVAGGAAGADGEAGAAGAEVWAHAGPAAVRPSASARPRPGAARRYLVRIGSRLSLVEVHGPGRAEAWPKAQAARSSSSARCLGKRSSRIV